MRSIKLKAARMNASLTQEEAAKRIGISASSLAKYEQYRRSVPLDIAWRLSALYRIPIQCLDPGDDSVLLIQK